jgi:hypothetical protein
LDGGDLDPDEREQAEASEDADATKAAKEEEGEHL